MEWIDNQLKERGLPRRALVDVVPGLTEKKISEIFSQKRKMSADEADAIRRFFGYRLPQDPIPEEDRQMRDLLARVDDRQKRAVILYLEAFLGTAPGHQQAS